MSSKNVNRVFANKLLTAIMLVVILLSDMSGAVVNLASQTGLPMGDVDGNNIVDIEDSRIITRYLTGQVDVLTYPENADVTQDGNITMEDAMAIAQKTTGSSMVVIAAPEHGLPGKISSGTLVRIDVFEHFAPYNVTGGTVRITSPGTGYDSGDQPLTFERNGRSLYYHWDTSGLSPASDYEVHITLTKNDVFQQNPLTSSLTLLIPTKPDIVLSNMPKSFENPLLWFVEDANSPAISNPLVFRRIFFQDSSHAPYLGYFGRGWSHNHDLFLEEFTDGRIAFFGPDGFNRWFIRNGDGTYSVSPGDYGKLTRDFDGTFQLKEKTGLIYRFRSDLRIDFVIDPNGNKINYIYNGNNKLVEIKHANGLGFQLEYNVFGRISKLIDHAGRETFYSYSNDGIHLLSATGPDGSVTRYAYSLGNGENSDHRLAMVEYPDGTHIYISYDSEGRLASKEMDRGIGRIEYSYELDGTTNIMDALGGITTVKADDSGKPLEVVDSLGRLIKYEYDSNQNLIKVIDQLSRNYEYGYDERGNVIQITDPSGNNIKAGYDPVFNKLSWLNDSLGRITTFSYDLNGNILNITYPDGLIEGFTYDNKGSLKSRTNRKGQKIEYTFDYRGLLTSKKYPDGKHINYSYDGIGRMISSTNDDGTSIYEYDIMDRVVRLTYPGSRIFQYEYDISGRRTRMIDPDGEINNYGYNGINRLSNITNVSGEIIVGFKYDNTGRRIMKSLGNGANTTYEYDRSGHILRLTNYGPSGNVISFFNYSYDKAGNRLSKETVDGIEEYTYDNLDQLIGVKYPNGNISEFIYDAMGNRITVKDNGIVMNYAVNELNQYPEAGTSTFQYDADGNLISRTNDGKTIFYDYDIEDRLIRVRSPEGTINYTYDAFGLRNSRNDLNGTTHYLRDGDQVAIEENSNHETNAKYVWGDNLDEAIRMQRNGSTYYYTQDAMKSVYDLLDASGNPVEHYLYSAMGEPIALNSVQNPWMFTGLNYDSNTRLQYNRFRFYDPSIGRFINQDPIGIAGGFNLYKYANNNAITFSDPSGMFWNFIAALIVKVIVPAIIKASTPKTKHDTHMPYGGGGIRGAPSVGGSTGGYGDIGAGTGDYNDIVGAGTGDYNDIVGAGTGDYDDIVGAGTGDYNDIVGAGTGDYNDIGGGTGVYGGIGGGSCPTFIQLLPSTKITTGETHINITHDSLAGKITVPIEGSLLRSDIPIFGVAGGTDFKEYRVEFGKGENPTEWNLIESSTIPKNAIDVGIADIPYMQGDVDIRGNLATWNTGLKNWDYLPWHPPEDPTDLNGIYSLRLTVIGQNGKKVEDRMTVEVGRAIAQTIPGIAISPDRMVTMRFPEHSLTEPFRIYTILPLSEIGEVTPSEPLGIQFISTIYRIRDPGDRFIKDVNLEFNVSADMLKGRNKDNIGIISYNSGAKEWKWLETSYQSGIFSAILKELPASKAIYALGYDTANIRSQPEIEMKQPELLSPVSSGILINDSFELDTGNWKSRDYFVGVTLDRARASSDGSYALKLTTQSDGGTFGTTVLDRSFDAREYPVISFDYRIGQGIKNDFYLLVNGRWYNLGFTDDHMDYKNRGVNIVNLGQIEGIKADDKWHTAKVNVYELLRNRTTDTKVDAIIMSDWDVTGYMKLEFGKNTQAAAYYIDNFKIASGPSYDTHDIVIDSFDTSTNMIGGLRGNFSGPGKIDCQDDIVRNSDNNNVLGINFNSTRSGSYCGYWTSLMNISLEEMKEVTLRLHTREKNSSIFMGLRNRPWIESKIPVKPYLGMQDNEGWQNVTIPLSAFTGLQELSSMDALFMTIESEIPGNRTLAIDNIEFHRRQSYGKVADFNIHRMERNLLGGQFETRENEAAIISADYHEDNIITPATGSARISYGGNVGLDYGGGRFSYATWETGLLGFDAHEFGDLVIKMRGEKGGEKPNIWLDDGTNRKTVRARDFTPVTTSWQEIHIPLNKFVSQGVDLSHLDAIQIVFEWENMSGTIYVDEIYFEGKPTKILPDELQTGQETIELEEAQPLSTKAPDRTEKPDSGGMNYLVLFGVVLSCLVFVGLYTIRYGRK